MIDKKELKRIKENIRETIKGYYYIGVDEYKIGIVTSAFDLMHAGHILMLKEAKEHCDCLVAALHDDPSIERPEKNKPIMSLEERILLIEANKYVDEYIIYETENDLITLFKELKPHVRFLGDDWRDKEWTGKELNIPIIWINRDHGYSTTELRKRIYEAEKKKELTHYHDVDEFYKD